MRTTAVALTGLVLVSSVALAGDPEVLTQAVSFAITGTDATKVTVVDRAQCIFKINNFTYYLNNVFADRIYVRNWSNKLGNFWATVDLHRKRKIVEEFVPAPVFTGSESDRLLMAGDPNYFATKAQTSTATDYTIRVETRESERLTKAWQYIYANGCKGMTSPF
jgi:hypothetical protein